jgi:2'-5' RNA ligase
MYAVEFFFEDAFEERVKDLWSCLKIDGISSFMADIEELRPHVTVAVYSSGLPVQQFISHLAATARGMSRMNVTFDAVSAFPTSGTVFLAPTMTSALFVAHRNYYHDLAEYNSFDSYNGLNFPDNWSPHCTLAARLNQDQLNKALKYCISRFEPTRGTITEIGLVKLEFVSGKCISSKTLFSCLLK